MMELLNRGTPAGPPPGPALFFLVLNAGPPLGLIQINSYVGRLYHVISILLLVSILLM
jgi:hypothetical protein